jgi:hypothetical protein
VVKFAAATPTFGAATFVSITGSGNED